MVKFIFLLIVGGIFFYGCSKANDKDSAPVLDSPTESKIDTANWVAGVTISTEQAKKYSAEDWQALADSHVHDFVVIPTESAYDDTEEGYKTQIAPILANAITQLASRRSNAQIWIGTPAISSKNYSIAGSRLDPFLNYLKVIRDQIDSKYWEKNIRGIYMNQESVYGDVDYTNVQVNQCIKLMSNLSDIVHQTLGKKFLWIPYYGYGSNSTEIIKRIGYVANQITIFDFIVIQPHYYFDGSVPQNLTGVRYCIKKQSVCYIDGTEVVSKSSKTLIGVEMELDWKIVPPNIYTDKLELYNACVSTFSEFKNICPIVFYYDGDIKNALSGRINLFF